MLTFSRAQSTYKRFVSNKKIHYMTEQCTCEFLVEGINNRYKHDALFNTYFYDYSAFKNLIYTIKEDDFKVYMGYFFTKDECEYIIPRILQRHTEVHICKLHNETKLKHDELTCELEIETMSNNVNNEATNVFWENSIIQMVLNVFQPVYDDLQFFFAPRFIMKVSMSIVRMKSYVY